MLRPSCVWSKARHERVRDRAHRSRNDLQTDQELEGELIVCGLTRRAVMTACK